MRRSLAVGFAVLAGILASVGSTAGGRSSWLPPVDVAPGPVAGGAGARVGLDGRGDAIILLGSCCTVRAVVRPAGGRFGAPVDVSAPAPGRFSTDAQLAVNERGDAAAVWADDADNAVYAAVRPAGGPFVPAGGSVLGIRAGSIPSGPVVALDSSGDATAVWGSGTYPNNFSVQAATRPAGGNWTTAETISTSDTQPIGVALAVDSKGNAIATWIDAKGPSFGVAAAFRPVGGRWEAPRDVSLTADYGSPQVALGASGEGVVVWKCCWPSSRVEAASFSVSDGTWAPPQDISPPDVAAGADAPQLALDAKGDALVVWTTSPDLIAQASIRPRGGTFSPPRTFALSAKNIQLAMNARGDAIVVWQRGFGLNSDLQASLDPAGGGFKPPATMPGSTTVPGAAIDAQGNAIVVWTPADGGVDAAAYDASGPELRSLRVPEKGKAGRRLRFAVSPVDVWSSVASTRWSFGDGAEKTGKKATHVYRRAGRYAVKVTSIDSLGHATTVTRSVRIGAS